MAAVLKRRGVEVAEVLVETLVVVPEVAAFPPSFPASAGSLEA